MKNNEVLIIGGGLAGLTAAIHLSKLGLQVTVIEKNSYPKHKVCGEYISNEVVDYFKWLGLEEILIESNHINQFRLEIHNNNFSEVALSLGGFGICRYLLDHLLYQKAVSQNCTFIHETVSDVTFKNDVKRIIVPDESYLDKLSKEFEQVKNMGIEVLVAPK